MRTGKGGVHDSAVQQAPLAAHAMCSTATALRLEVFLPVWDGWLESCLLLMVCRGMIQEAQVPGHPDKKFTVPAILPVLSKTPGATR